MYFEEALKLVGSMKWYQISVVSLMAYCSWTFLANMMIMVFAGLKLPPKCQNFTSGCGNQSFFQSTVTDWGIGDAEITMVNMAQYSGIFLGTFLVGHMSDRYGRRTTWFFGALVMAIFGAGSAVSPNWQVLAAMRFCVGICAAGMSTAVTTMLTEITSKSHRLWMVGMYMQWELGFPLMALWAYLTQNWRYVCLIVNLQIIPGLICFLFIFESPRWLLQTGKTEEAVEVLKKIAGRNKVELKADAMANLKPEVAAKSLGWKALFTNGLFRKRLLALSFCTFTTYAVMYGLMLNTGALIGNVYINVTVFGLLKLIPGLATALGDTYFHIGRKPMMIAGYAGMFVCMSIELVLIILKLEHQFSWVLDAAAIVGGAFSNPAAVIGYLFPSEIFPTLVRNRAAAISSSASRFATILSPLILFSKIAWEPLPYIIFAAFPLVAMLISGVFLPETKGKMLPETGL